MYMNIDEIKEELGVLQLSDSFFPTGIFAGSNGLEYLFSKKKINGVSEMTELIKIQITQQIGPADCVAISNAYDFLSKKKMESIVELDNILFATKLVKEIRESSVRSGIQLIKCVKEFSGENESLIHYSKFITDKKCHGIFPVAFAISCNTLKIKKEKCMMIMMYSFAVSIVGAALRLGLIQHFEGQKIIHNIKPIISEMINEISDGSLTEIWQFAPQLDVVQMLHEKMDSKMFIT